MTDSVQRVLLVEDEIRLRQGIARAIRAHAYEVDEAETCREAVLAATVADYAVLLLDINLPDATGWDVLRQLDRIGRRPSTIVISAVTPSASRVREFNPTAVLQKPFPIEALLRLVNQQRDTGERN